MLNRLMFIYFIQQKGFLNGDRNYLKTKLEESRAKLGKDRYYRDFLCPLFFEGFAKRPTERSPKVAQLLGNVPYLNGGIFQQHQIEQLHGRAIKIPDAAFEKLYDLFAAYQWHLDDRPTSNDSEIRPDVLGYIFEKYINQKQMGAYYTKEDITDYIGKNTIIPFLFDSARQSCEVAFAADGPVWRLLREDPDRYIYPAVKHGVSWDIHENKPLAAPVPYPPEIAEGLDTSKPNLIERRKAWNKPAPPECALPTEIWREVVARRTRYEEIRAKLAGGEVHSINDLITYNLDVRLFAQDVIGGCEGPELLAAFWKALESVSVLDPTCGSGAFIFAALNILEPLYEECLERMRFFLEEWGANGKKNHPIYWKLFTEILRRVDEHPNRPYFILKSIMVNNLYGVDIMEEATEICKLRLFLKLVSQIERVEDLEPLPDIDFNIRAGNTLVGFASLEDVRKTLKTKAGDTGKLGFAEELDELAAIEEEAHVCDGAFARFRECQTELAPDDGLAAKVKAELRKYLDKLNDKLNRFLAAEYGVRPSKKDEYEKWLASHRPFHWFSEFYGILKRGGFDVITGNPPYVNTVKVRKSYSVKGFTTERCPDIYAWMLERVAQLTSKHGCSGMICPLSLGFSDDFKPCRQMLFTRYSENWFSSFGRIPSALFNFDVRVRNTIHIGHRGTSLSANHTTRLHRWFNEARPCLFPAMQYADFNETLWNSRIPKINTTRLVQAFEKHLANNGSRLGQLLSSRPTKHRLYFKKTAYNWLNFCRRLPPCYDAVGVAIAHTKFGEFSLPTAEDRDLCFLLLNGKIEFSFWVAIGDDFDVTKWMFTELPINPVKLEKKVKANLLLLVEQLDKAMKEATSFKLNAGKKVGNFNLAKCRHITDNSDAIFARHFGFDDVWDDIELFYSQLVRTNFESEEES
jgi:hypothetical protein